MTTTTFAEYSAQAEARKDIQQAVLGHTLALCEALRMDFINHSIKMHQRSLLEDPSSNYHTEAIEKLRKGIADYDFVIETGRKYHKIVMVSNQRSVHAFVDKKTGELYKPAGWKSPAKHVRGNLLDSASREDILQRCDWAGGYLYMR